MEIIVWNFLHFVNLYIPGLLKQEVNLFFIVGEQPNYFHSIDLREQIFIYSENWGQPGCFAYNQFPQLYLLTEIYIVKVYNIKININANLWIFQFSTVNCFHGFHNFFHSIDLRENLFIYSENWGQPGRFAYNQFPQLYLLTEIYIVKVYDLQLKIDISPNLHLYLLLCCQA